MLVVVCVACVRAFDVDLDDVAQWPSPRNGLAARPGGGISGRWRRSPSEEIYPGRGKVQRAYWGALTAAVRGSVTPFQRAGVKMYIIGPYCEAYPRSTSSIHVVGILRIDS
eukprot:COSAG06_NODE_4515_length_4189_cov_12.834230_3_plen_111_part_00